ILEHYFLARTRYQKMRLRRDYQRERLELCRYLDIRIEFKEAAAFYFAEIIDLAVRRYRPKNVGRVARAEFERPRHFGNRKINFRAVARRAFDLCLALHSRKARRSAKLNTDFL